MRARSQHQEGTIDSGELVSPRTPSFREALRRDRDQRYPITATERELEERVSRVCARIASFLPGSEVPELLLARETFQTAIRLGDARGIEAARVAAVSACLQLALSVTLPALAEISEELSGIEVPNISTSADVIGVARSSVTAYDESLNPSSAVARSLLHIPTVRSLIDTLLGVEPSGIINTTKRTRKFIGARFAQDLARRFPEIS